jgi:hypothetical protein
VRTDSLNALVRALDGRWRLRHLFATAVDIMVASVGCSILWVLIHAVFDIGPDPSRALIILNGIALVAALTLAGLRKHSPERLLLDADKAYSLRELLVSGFEFSQATESESPTEQEFRRLVVEKANNASLGVDPLTVYPRTMPRRTPLLAALLVCLGVLGTLIASGWFDRPTPAIVDSGLLLEEAGRRLAERAPESDELQQLADEIRALGDRMRNNEITPEEARRQIELLGREVEEQMRNLDRTLPFENSENAEIPPETEDTIRRALRSGMSEDEVTELFTRMRSDGNTLPDIIDALDEASPDSTLNTDIDIDPEQIRDLMDQLNRTPEEDALADAAEELERSRSSLRSPRGPTSELSPGEDRQPGEGGSTSMSAPPEGQAPGGGAGDPSAGDNEEQEGAGQSAGDQPVEDTNEDDFSLSGEAGRTIREIQGTITEETIMDIIIRELPSEATSELTEEERDVQFQRVVEEAVGRGDTPPDLQRLVRNYFLRVTMATEEGAEE